MGMDFTAILRYDPSSDAVARTLDALEAADRPSPLQAVVRRWQEAGFFKFYEDWLVPVWVERPDDDDEAELPARPPLPSLQASLRLPEGFFLTLAKDAVLVDHLLRWRFFLTDSKWQTVMLDSLTWFCNHFAAKDCVLAHDCQCVPSCIRRQGLSFAEALSRAEQEGEGQVKSLSDLYLEMEDDSDFALKPAEGGLARQVKWPRDKPLPPGWSRPTVWDSKGYWRYTW
jgi:hypothetical protein